MTRFAPPLDIPVLRLPHGKDLSLPVAATELSAGVDLRAAVPESETLILAPGERALVPTGFAVAIPPGFEGQVRPRSGLAVKHGVSVLNSPGTIDADYRGEIKVILINHGSDAFPVERGDRIAQLVVSRCERVAWRLVEELPDTERGGGGFGHTGR